MPDNNRKIELYDDGIGFVELVDHLGSDLSVVNSARVSFGSHKESIGEKDEKLIKYLVDHKHTSTLANKQTSRQANKHTSKQADKQTSKQAHKQTSTQAHKHTSTQANKHTSTLAH